MAANFRQGGDPLRQQAMGRAREMVRGVEAGRQSRRQAPPASMAAPPTDPLESVSPKWRPIPPPTPAPAPNPDPRPRPKPAPPKPPPPSRPSRPSQPPRFPLLGALPFGEPTALLAGLDGDTMLILALMVMLYKDGRTKGYDKKLLMALAYLLV